jgi:predicted methyltransferase
MKNHGIFLVCLGLALNLAPVAADEMSDQLAAALTAEGRPDGDIARDPIRKPDEVLSFLGLESGMTVLDLTATSGYYTEILAGAVGADGKVYAHNIQRMMDMFDGRWAKGLDERLAGDRLPNVEAIVREFDELGLDGEIDFAFWGLNLHDIEIWYGEEAAISSLQAIFNALKPGGLLGITEHVGVEGQDNAKLHRMEILHAVELLRTAGFEVDAVNENILRNEADDHTLRIFDESLGRNTDRYIILARRP